MANLAGSTLLLLDLVARETTDEGREDDNAKNLQLCEPAHTYGGARQIMRI